MIKRVFVDSDIIIDVATGRLPFFSNSKSVLTPLERGFAVGYVSSNIITNVVSAKSSASIGFRSCWVA